MCRTTRQKGLSRVYNLTEDSPLPKQVLVLNVSANKKQVIQMIVDKLSSAQIPHGKHVVITGHPVQVGIGEWQTSTAHEEADVIMAYHMVKKLQQDILQSDLNQILQSEWYLMIQMCSSF